MLSDSTKCKYMHYSGYIVVVLGWSYKWGFSFFGFTLQSSISKLKVTFEFSGTVYYVNGEVSGLFPKAKWGGHLILNIYISCWFLKLLFFTNSHFLIMNLSLLSHLLIIPSNLLLSKILINIYLFNYFFSEC